MIEKKKPPYPLVLRTVRYQTGALPTNNIPKFIQSCRMRPMNKFCSSIVEAFDARSLLDYQAVGKCKPKIKVYCQNIKLFKPLCTPFCCILFVFRNVDFVFVNSFSKKPVLANMSKGASGEFRMRPYTECSCRYCNMTVYVCLQYDQNCPWAIV